MDKLFLTILNMSLTGAFVIAAICLARLPLKKAPKIISYCLWAVAGFRLVFPFNIESEFSLIPFKAQTIPTDIATQAIPRIDSGIPFINNAVNGVLPAAAPAASANPLQIWTAIGAWVWLIGASVMLIYGVASYVRLKHKMRSAIRVEGNLYEMDGIHSPFVLGILKPKIYIPLSLSGREREYIILHEQTHIRRRDHIVKFAAYFILCLHWFNPLAWMAFLLMGIDMEMSCDERVMNEMGDRSLADSEAKKDYSLSLLSLASNRRIIGGSPLAFAEGCLKERIKRVLNFKKPSRIIITAAVVLVAVLNVGFAVNRVSREFPMTGDDSVEQATIANSGNALAPVSIIIQGSSPNGVSYQFENKTYDSYVYGEGFALYRRENNTWQPVDPIIDNWGFHDIGYDIEPQSTSDTLTIDWLWLFGQLPYGEYKIEKDVLLVRAPGDYDKFVIDAYFTLSSETVVPSINVSIPILGEKVEVWGIIPHPVAVTISDDSVLSLTELSGNLDICWYVDDGFPNCAYRRQGGDWIHFLKEDSGYSEGFGAQLYSNLFGQSGFCVFVPRGAAYFAVDYYYFDTKGELNLLFQGTYLDTISDFNSDGKNELLWFYHGGREATYNYSVGDDIFAFDIINALYNRFSDWEYINADPLSVQDGILQVTYQRGGLDYYAQIHFVQNEIIVTSDHEFL